MANVYPIAHDSTLRTISVQTKSFDTTARYDLYLMDEDATEPSDGELLWSKEETYPYGGLHRVEIPEPIAVKVGEDGTGTSFADYTWEDLSDTPVYRLYNPNTGEHLYTDDANELDQLQKVGWQEERIGWYGVKV